MTTVILVGCGGFIGSIIRFLLGSYLSKVHTSAFPYSTMIINLLGSFIIGL